MVGAACRTISAAAAPITEQNRCQEEGAFFQGAPPSLLGEARQNLRFLQSGTWEISPFRRKSLHLPVCARQKNLAISGCMEYNKLLSPLGNDTINSQRSRECAPGTASQKKIGGCGDLSCPLSKTGDRRRKRSVRKWDRVSRSIPPQVVLITVPAPTRRKDGQQVGNHLILDTLPSVPGSAASLWKAR